MAWTEQCKIHFKTVADAKYFKNGSKGIIRILKELSSESGIPYKTLYRWWHEQESLKNENNPQTPNNTEKTEPPPLAAPTVCIRCNTNVVEKSRWTKKPYPPDSENYGLCAPCRKKKTKIKKKVISEDQTGLPMTCPNCKHVHYLNVEELKKWIKN
jgi:hypothetical protein